MNPVIEFASGTERVTATVNMSTHPGFEAFQGALHIGFYPGSDEVFLVCEDARINLPAHLIKPILAQIKRAAKIAGETP